MNKKLIKECFDSSANTYDSVAEIQRLSSKKLVEMINKDDVFSILDVGCGTGNTSLELYKKYPDAEYTFCDISEKMLELASRKFSKKTKIICADAENFMFPERYDLAISNLGIQWFLNQETFIERMSNYCKTFAFSTLLNSAFRKSKLITNFQIQKYSLEFENLFAVKRYFKKLGAYAESGNKIQMKNVFGKMHLDFEIFFSVLDF